MEINYEQEDEYRMCRHFPAGVCLERSCRNNDITPSNDQGTPSGHYPVADPSFGFACKIMW